MQESLRDCGHGSALGADVGGDIDGFAVCLDYGLVDEDARNEGGGERVAGADSVNDIYFRRGQE